MTWKNKIYKIDLDIAGYESDLGSYLTEQTKQAAVSYLKTVLQIIPTWSRASRATFEDLANAVGFSIPYGPLEARRDRTALGRATGTGGLLIDPKGHSYHFYYETTLKYLAYNEFNKAKPGPPPQPFGQLKNPTPYNFQEAGERDFESYTESFVKVPSPLKYITGKRI